MSGDLPARTSVTGEHLRSSVPRGPWCVECAQEKKGDNHWFKYVACENFFLLLPLDALEHGAPLCGEVCASKRVSRWMSEQVKQRPSN